MNGEETAPRRKMTRCPEGHIFDAAAHEACPTCGAKPAAPSPEGGAAKAGAGNADAIPAPPPDPSPAPAWLKPALIGGGAIVAILIIALMLRGGPSPETPQIAAKEANRPAGGERWRTTMVIAGKTYVCVNETWPDGRYRRGDGCPPPIAGETGVTMVAPDGSWSSRADNGRVDSGTLEVVSADKIIAHTQGGSVVWERVKD